MNQKCGVMTMKFRSKTGDKIKTNFAKIVVSGLFDGKPYYEIMWFCKETNELNFGYGSYFIKYVIQWFRDCFEVVEDDAVEGMCCDCAHGGPCCSPDENTNCADRKEDGTCWVPYTKEEADMGKQEKPLICKILGVEEDEEWSVKGEDTIYRIHEKCRQRKAANTWIPVQNEINLMRLINHPDRILRKPRWTEQEVEDAKAIKRVLKATGIRRNRYDNIYATGELIVDTLLDSEAFPSLQPDTAVTIDEIIGGAQ